MRWSRVQTVGSGLIILAIVGASLAGLALGRSSARPRVPTTQPPITAPPTVPPPTAPPTTVPPSAPPTTTPPVVSPPTTTPPTTAPPVFATEQPGTWQVRGLTAGRHLNVRSGPGIGNEVVAQLAHDAAEIRSTGSVARVDGSLWRQVEYRTGRNGWVNAAFLEPFVPRPVFGTEKPGLWDVTGLSAGQSLNVRSGPGTASPVLRQLAHDIVQLPSTGKTATVSGSLWRQVQINDNGELGWVSARFLKPHTPAPPAPRSPGIIVMGDWQGRGVRTPAVFRDGVWHVRLSNSSGPADLVFEFGAAGDVPVVGDWDGNGSETPGVVRNGVWHLRNAASAGAADAVFEFGAAGDRPVAGDWNGDGIDTPGAVRGATWHLRNANSAGAADLVFTFGDPGDRPVAGDWNGDGIDTPGAVRGSAVHLASRQAGGASSLSFTYAP